MKASTESARPAEAGSAQFHTEIPSIDQFYRCPGCGEMVEASRRDEVRAHHQHVLHPRQPKGWWQKLTGSTAAQQLRNAVQRSPNGSNGSIMPDRSRRYGHG